MNFWKLLCNLLESTLPEWRDKFISYKKLKKQLKLMYPDKDGEGPTGHKRPKLDGEECEDGADVVLTTELENFLSMLEEEVDKFNQFFEVKEEFYVIKMKLLQEKVAKMEDSDEMRMRIGREIVDFHGEMVLLENYSALNYTGLVKILKKYDKRSGELIRMPYIKKVLREPFYSTDVLSKLLKECEMMLDFLFSKKDMSSCPAEAANDQDAGCSKSKSRTESEEKLPIIPEDLAEIKDMENMYLKLTISALRVLKDIRRSSTVDVFSWLPEQNKR